MSTFKIEWLDRHREPQCPSNPDFPNGIDVDVSLGAEQSCVTELPYPARRCGLYIAECERCGLRVGVTTAGRPDDPRSLRVACLLETKEPLQ